MKVGRLRAIRGTLRAPPSSLHRAKFYPHGRGQEVFDELEVRRQERYRITRELHDSTSQLLVALQLSIASLKERLKAARYEPLLSELDSTLNELHDEVRAVVSTTWPSDLPPGLLPLALQNMVERFGRRSKLTVSVVVQGHYVALPAQLELTLYRIAQEALANVQRHARASAIRLILNCHKTSLTLIVEDDGVGFRQHKGVGLLGSGVGLRNIRDRVRELNGRMSLRKLTLGSRLTVGIHF